MKNKSSLLKDFRNIGIREGDSLCVHSSLKSIGDVDGGAETVIHALLEAIGSSGTLMFPAFTFYLLHEESPVFSYADSHSCVGYLSECFRQNFARKRSIHISHSYSVTGAKTEFYCNHPLEITPCGAESPLAKLMADGGKVMLLGCGYNTLTAVHVFEESEQVPYVKFHNIPGAQLNMNGVISPLPSQVVYPFSYDFTRLESHFNRSGVVAAGKIGNAETKLLDGVKMAECVTRILRQNKNYLMCSSE